MPVVLTTKGDFSKSLKFLNNLRWKKLTRKADKYGKMGVDALKQATPRDTGTTAESWFYEVYSNDNRLTIYWCNRNLAGNPGRYQVNVAVLIQYGHATRNGGFVVGYDYINPTMLPIFEKIAKDLWMEVSSS